MSSHIPRKRFGQHFLHDRRIIGRIIDSLKINQADRWLEIGPGQGALTHFMPKEIEHLYLVEIDRDLAEELEIKYQDSPNITVIRENILKLDFTPFMTGKINSNHGKLRLLGNLPYNISTPIFFHLAQFSNIISDMTFMVQKEVADRLVAKPGSKIYGRLSLSAGLRFKIIKLFDVGAGAFNPPPKVKSSIVRLEPYTLDINPILSKRFDDLTRIAFSKRRKTLKNSLSKHLPKDAFEQTQVDPSLRPESLSIDDFLKLAKLN